MKSKIIKLLIKTETPFNISSGAKSDGYVKDISIRDRNGKPFIPGTTIKGEIRNNYLIINGEEESDNLFGSKDTTSKIIVDDFCLINNEKIIVRYGNAIDRFRKVTKEGALFSKEGISGTFQGEIEVYYENEKQLEDLQLAIKMITSIGGSKSTGFGKVKIEEVIE
ncbi:MAG: hypothetical protein E7214_10735 [Clostridium sp.]|nr:hypothetical protein [Clostridium sp.]